MTYNVLVYNTSPSNYNSVYVLMLRAKRFSRLFIEDISCRHCDGRMNGWCGVGCVASGVLFSSVRLTDSVQTKRNEFEWKKRNGRKDLGQMCFFNKMLLVFH